MPDKKVEPSSFLVTTNTSRTRLATEDEPAASGEPSLSGVRILLVEDSWHVATAMTGLAKSAGMVVVGPAATVAEAEQLLLSHALDVAVVDINLRGEQAYGLIDRLHAHGVPIIVASGYETHTSVENKVAAILAKPFSGEALLTTVHRIIEGSKVRRSLR